MSSHLFPNDSTMKEDSPAEGCVILEYSEILKREFTNELEVFFILGRINNN